MTCQSFTGFHMKNTSEAWTLFSRANLYPTMRQNAHPKKVRDTAEICYVSVAYGIRHRRPFKARATKTLFLVLLFGVNCDRYVPQDCMHLNAAAAC